MSVLVGRACRSAQMSWSIGLYPGACVRVVIPGFGALGVSEERSGGVSEEKLHSFCFWASVGAPRGVPRGAATLAPGKFFCFCLKYRCLSPEDELERVTRVAALVLCFLADCMPI